MDFQFVPVVVTLIVGLISGAFGAGIAIATFRSDIRELKRSVHEIIGKQERLRGNGGTTPPLFIRRDECQTYRAGCNATAILMEHTKEIKSLRRFAQWSMHEAGLTPHEINEILKAD